MTDVSVSVPPNRVRTIGVWVLRVLLALAFGAAAFTKISGVSMMVAEFGKIGLGQWFRYFTAATEIIGAILVLMPRTTFYGAIVLLAICAGAFVAQIGPLHGDMVHVFVLGGVAALTAWLTQPISR